MRGCFPASPHISWCFGIGTKSNKNLSFTTFACSELEHINKGSKDNLGSYLAGLIEGDGSIIVPSAFRNEKVNYCTPPLTFASLK